jgi:DNA invertase Pin-like site-specific DNA recombinase
VDYTHSGKKVSIEGLRNLPGSIYLRVSLDDSKQDVESQREAVLAWCRKHNLEVPKSRVFEDSQGYTPRHKFDRPAFSKLEKEVEAGRVKWVVVWNQKRFGGGDPWHFAAKIQDFRQADCQVWDVEDRCLSADDAYSFIIGGMNANSSRDEVITRTKDSMRTKLLQAKKGVYPGGFVPFGCDIACIRADGSERWRIVVEGHHKRLQVYPDGRTERYDGKGSFPSTQEGDTLFLRPSHDKKKIEVVKYVFETYATQSISTYLIARALNKMGSRPTYSKVWQASHVESILKNSVYIGRPSWSKQGQGQHLEFVNGEVSPVGKTYGRRWRTEDQHIQSEKPIFDPETFISMATWEAVRAKLPCDDSARPRRAPKSAAGWLSSIVFCKGCGVKMRGQSRPGYFQYSCSSYDKSRDTGEVVCARNSISQGKIEEHLWRYLEETAQAAEVLAKAATLGDADLMATVPEGLSPLFDRLQSITLKMMATLQVDPDALEVAVLQDAGDVENARALLDAGDLGGAQVVVDRHRGRLEQERKDLLAAYRQVIGGSRERFHQRREELVAEFDRLKGALTRTTNKRMQASLDADIDKVSSELDSIEEHLGSLDEDFETVVREINDFCTSVKEALRERGGDQPRVLAEEVEKILSRIEIEFKPTGLKYPQSVPVSITFVPRIGTAVTNDVSH